MQTEPAALTAHDRHDVLGHFGGGEPDSWRQAGIQFHVLRHQPCLPLCGDHRWPPATTVSSTLRLRSPDGKREKQRSGGTVNALAEATRMLGDTGADRRAARQLRALGRKYAQRRFEGGKTEELRALLRADILEILTPEQRQALERG